MCKSWPINLYSKQIRSKLPESWVVHSTHNKQGGALLLVLLATGEGAAAFVLTGPPLYVPVIWGVQ